MENKIDEKVYQRLKRELLEEINVRIFDKRNECNDGFIENIANEIITKSRIRAKKKITKEQMDSLIELSIEETIKKRVDLNIKSWLKYGLKPVIEQQKVIITEKIKKDSTIFLNDTLPEKILKKFEEIKENLISRKLYESARDELLKLVSISDIELVSGLREKYKSVAREIKEEILEELKEDLRSIKRNGK